MSVKHHCNHTEVLKVETHPLNDGQQLLEKREICGRKLHCLGKEKLLCARKCLFSSTQSFFVDDAFMSCMLINDRRSDPGLCEEKPVLKLPEDSLSSLAAAPLRLPICRGYRKKRGLIVLISIELTGCLHSVNRFVSAGGKVKGHSLLCAPRPSCGLPDRIEGGQNPDQMYLTDS